MGLPGEAKVRRVQSDCGLRFVPKASLLPQLQAGVLSSSQRPWQDPQSWRGRGCWLAALQPGPRDGGVAQLFTHRDGRPGNGLLGAVRNPGTSGQVPGQAMPSGLSHLPESTGPHWARPELKATIVRGQVCPSHIFLGPAPSPHPHSHAPLVTWPLLTGQARSVPAEQTAQSQLVAAGCSFSRWLEKNFCEMSLHQPRSPACLHARGLTAPQPLTPEETPQSSRPQKRQAEHVGGSCGLTSWARPSPPRQRGPPPWLSAAGVRRACRGPSLCRTRPPRCRA